MVKKAQKSAETAPQVLSLTKDELLLMRALSAERELAQKCIVLAGMKRAELLRQIDPQNILGSLESEASAQRAAEAQAISAYKELYLQIEARLGLKLADYVWDDRTGSLLPQSGIDNGTSVSNGVK
jgi:hypothetical protein